MSECGFRHPISMDIGFTYRPETDGVNFIDICEFRGKNGPRPFAPTPTSVANDGPQSAHRTVNNFNGLLLKIDIFERIKLQLTIWCVFELMNTNFQLFFQCLFTRSPQTIVLINISIWNKFKNRTISMLCYFKSFTHMWYLPIVNLYYGKVMRIIINMRFASPP